MVNAKHYTEREKLKAVQEVVHLVQQGFRNRGDISMIGISPCGSENALCWAEEQGAIWFGFDDTILLSDEKAPEFNLDWTPVPESLNDELNELMLEHLRHQSRPLEVDEVAHQVAVHNFQTGEDEWQIRYSPLAPNDLVQVSLAELYALGLEGRCTLGCKLPLEACTQYHQWLIFRRKLKYRGEQKYQPASVREIKLELTPNYRVWTGPQAIIERARRAASKKFYAESKPLGGKYETWLLKVGHRLPEYLVNQPEEAPVEF